MVRGKQVLIVGGGVIGLCSAYYLLKKEHRVTLIERGGPEHDCCSLGNAGMIVPSHFVPLAAPGMISRGIRWMFDAQSPFYIRPRLSMELLSWGLRFYRASTKKHVIRSAPILRDLSLASRECFLELSNLHNIDFDLTTKGLLMLCKEERTLHEEAEVAQMAHELGLEARVVDSRELTHLEPALRMDVAGGVYFPQDACLSPGRFMNSLTNLCIESGLDIKWNAELRRLVQERDSIQCAETSRGEFTADEYLIAGGAWSSVMTTALNVSLPMQAGKGYSITVEQPTVRPTICSILCEARVAVTPMENRLRFAGTMEIAGLDQSVNRRRVMGIIRSVPRYYPEIREEELLNVPIWSGLRPCTPDGLPYIGRFRNYKNLSVATGHAMMGLSLGPITGKLISEVLNGESPRIKIDALSPDRYL